MKISTITLIVNLGLKIDLYSLLRFSDLQVKGSQIFLRDRQIWVNSIINCL